MRVQEGSNRFIPAHPDTLESPPANTMLRVWLLKENEKPGSAVKGLSNCLKFTSWGSPQGLILPVSYPSVHSTLVDHRWTKF